ncbi:hypothetical protein GUY44_00870 [Pimelobacter simplex]|uniref:Uncharacterized protein n=1 Tax=Nocardioides simplex TaxID=2045 RepID=A0A0A1DR90_NOCSI|nr:hypothetical protein [Pimelobacter simplex]AIY19033.1 hypothetical protein KR76_23705 [Pimelobacter simplex]MCG8149011.1 hypothetical protein [Pimelobacter simplex]GEB14819.1 hypothetical protein NSI01_31340 [Pimelobacter simplex]SFM24874.1 hypothetical protein SAMN05421671_0595 [Pimelobacter simplex]
MSGFLDQVEPVFTELADLLGQLAGNEAAVRLQDAEWDREAPEGWTHERLTFTVPGTYGFERVSGVVMMSPQHPDWFTSRVTNGDRERLMQEAIDTVWRDAHTSWTGGAVPSLYRIASQNVWEPDAAAVATSASAFGDLTLFLQRQLRPGAGWVALDDPVAPEWLAALGTHWPTTSDSASSFFAFWDDVNDKCSLYLHAAARLASTTARTAAALSDFQTNLLDVAKAARDHARLALRQWQQWKEPSGSWPTGAIRDNSQPGVILGTISYWTGLAALIPFAPVSITAGGVSLVTGTLDYFIQDQVVVMESLQAATADEIHSAFMNDLATLDTHLRQVLDAIRTEPTDDGSSTGAQGFSSYVADVGASHRDWSPPEVRL